jgi:hypothetical protein
MATKYSWSPNQPSTFPRWVGEYSDHVERLPKARKGPRGKVGKKGKKT